MTFAQLVKTSVTNNNSLQDYTDPVDHTSQTYFDHYKRQGDRVVSVSDSQSSCPGFESCCDYHLDLFHDRPRFKSSAMLVNNQLVCLRPVGIVLLCSIWIICFGCLLDPTSLCAINTAEGKWRLYLVFSGAIIRAAGYLFFYCLCLSWWRIFCNMYIDR